MIFDGKMFLPPTGIPILKIDLMSIVFADWLPLPFTVATLITKSLIFLLMFSSDMNVQQYTLAL